MDMAKPEKKMFISRELDRALVKAKIGIMTKENTVFWSTVCMGLNHHFSDQVPTAGTDGIAVKYSPQFFMEGCKNNEQRTGLVFHELGHVVFQHVQRRGERDHKLYNIAGDHVINLLGDDAGFTFPDGAYMDEKYKGWSTEQIYDDLIQDPPPDVEDFICDLDPDGGDSPSNEDGKSTGSLGNTQQQAIDDLLVRGVMAAQAADQPGSIPGEIRRYVERLINPPIPWDSILRQFMTRFDQSRYNYKTPNRRFFPHVFVPKRKSKALGKITMAVDASASVSDEEFATYVAGADAVLKRFKPSSMEFLQFTTRITGRAEIKTPRDLANLKFVGKGGTSVYPVMEYAAEEKPAVLLLFSDGHFKEPKINPGIPVVWIIHNNKRFTAPFGKVIHFNMTEVH